MRIISLIVQVTLIAPLFSCDSHQSTPAIDPKLGLECFDIHRTSLPPGTQYEGIEKVIENRLTVKIMNGIEVVTIDCGMKPDGTLEGIIK